MGLGSSTFASLSEPEYLWYFAGNIAFFMGMQMQFVLRGYLAFELTDAASALGLVSASIALPMLVSAPFGGVVADRVNKRNLLIITQSVAAAASMLIAVLILMDLIRFWHLIAISVATGGVFSFNMPARQALVPLLVPRHKMQNAISLQMGGMNLTRIIAPSVAGLLIAPIGLGWVYMITFFLFVLAVASEFHLPKVGMGGEVPPVTKFFEDFAAGFRYIAQHRTIAMLLAAGSVIPLLGFPVQMLLPVFAKDVYGMGPSGLGLLATMTGVGGLIGALYSATLDRIAAKGRIMMIGGFAMGTFLVAFALSPWFVGALLFLALANIGQMLFMSTNNTVIQSNLPGEIRGRVMSVMMMSFGIMPFGVLPISLLADQVGAPRAIGASSVVLLVVLGGMFFLTAKLRNLRMEQFATARLSPVQAARLVAQGRLTPEEAARMTGEAVLPRWDAVPAPERSAGAPDRAREPAGEGVPGKRGPQPTRYQ